ncbi:MAG: glycosyltransferase [Bacteroidetes bacterium GWF2_42_66]|nr:MAG: glycosyltransferase [Bacteroidetes bacterium GWA2_42_15]OFX98067.1 MAG: glycosyltransferase [Bacteroidetes bacterium GWE2_42_39]OFY42450.1 MAG: glycosyltransferase [Bacteroidetes bacterium GWF2_42_66]HBL74160.1 glycosyltransferase family 1 protein [Prolixibacteraceae bacterium]HCR91646.1 glycosyltransferase family 1 protein [Prolixibacteraceae bacterium]
MNIAVNTRLLLKGKLEGIGFFTKETLARITRAHPGHQFIFIFDRPYSDEFIFSDNITPVIVSPPTRHPFLWIIWFELRIPAILKKYKADLFFSPDGYLSLNTKVPQIAAIHDLNFVHRPNDLPWLKAKYYNFFFPRFARRARRIVTVSNYSKDDIVHSYKINPDKIDVAYNGINSLYVPVSEDEKLVVRQKYTDGCEYFLFIGSLHPRKNICGLLRAYDAFRNATKTNMKLVIAGGELFKTGNIEKTFRRMRHKSDVIFTGRISSEELHLVLGAALCLTFVPFFEGFGIPVVEAMSAGVPVISSNTTSLPEVGGNAVVYVDPSFPEEIKDAMMRIAQDKNLRDELIEKGFRQKEKFSWDKTAEVVWAAIQKESPISPEASPKGKGD